MSISDDGFPLGTGTLGNVASFMQGVAGGIRGITPDQGNIGGAGGTLGANTLQQSLDSLTNAVNRLTNVVGSLNMGSGSSPTTPGLMTGGPGRPGFPPVYNPFRPSGPTGGIGGGGPGGTGNITPPNTFGSRGGNAGYGVGAGVGAIMGSFIGYGQSQLPAQLAMNAYVAQTRLAMGPGTSFPRAQSAALMQATGIGNANLNALAVNPQDAVAMAQALQYAGGAPQFMQTPIGRGAYGATAAFGYTNPLLSGASAAGLAQQIYNPTLSMRMLSLGYPSQPRVLGGGANNSATFAQSLFRAWTGGRTNINPSTLAASLAQGGRANVNLQALGLNPTQMTPFLTAYNDLFRQGMNPNQAQQLLNAAAQNRPGAQQTLQNLGVSTTDIQKIKNAQSALTGRDAAIANSFNAALSAATTTLEDFNKALTVILQKTPLGNAVGYGGGLGAVFGGTSGLNSLLGIGGALSIGRALGAGRGLMGGAGGLAGAAGGGGLLGTLGVLGAGAGGVLGAGWMAHNTLTSSGASMNTGSAMTNILHGIGNFFTGTLFKRMFQNTGGGAGGTPTSSQQRTAGGNQGSMGGGVGGSAMAAVSAAEKEVGLPYIWGGETPGVGFDCSGLIQWAYKQAGISIPRTSEQQWAFLKKKAVPTNQAQEGDIVFQAGSDGTASAPGHEAMLVSRNSIVEAPFTGANVRIRGYNPREWLYAARVTGRGGGTPIGGSSSSSNPQGNSGLGLGPAFGGTYGSTEEVDAISSSLAGGGFAGTGFGAAGSGSGTGGAGASTGGGQSIAGLRGNKKIMNQVAARYGWGTGREWAALNQLEMHEAGYNNLAQNPTSTAYGMGQFLDTTWGTVGGHKTSDPTLQSQYMMKYIRQRYHDPLHAWAQYFNHPGGVGWYGAGTGRGVDSGISIVGDRGPEIMIGGAGGRVLNNAQSMALLKAVSKQPTQSPWSTLNELTQTSQATGSSNVNNPNITLNFRENAIVVKVNHTGSDASSSGRAVAREIVKSLEDERIYTAIGTGNKSGVSHG